MVAIIVPGRFGPRIVGGTSGGGAAATNWDPTSTATTSDAYTLSGSNLIVTVNTNINVTANAPCTRTVASIAATGVKKYWEVTRGPSMSGGCMFGIGDGTPNMENYQVGQNTHSVGIDKDGNVQYNGGFNVLHAAIQSNTATHTGCFAVDTTLKRLWMNTDGNTGNWNGSSGSEDPASGTGGIDISSITGPYYPMASAEVLGQLYTGGFGSTFLYSAPSGFSQI